MIPNRVSALVSTAAATTSDESAAIQAVGSGRAVDMLEQEEGRRRADGDHVAARPSALLDRHARHQATCVTWQKSLDISEVGVPALLLPTIPSGKGHSSSRCVDATRVVGSSAS